MLSNPSYPLKINDIEYSAKTFTDRDEDELVLYARSRLIQISRQVADNLGLIGEARSEHIQEAQKLVMGLEYDTPDFWDIMGPAEENIRLGWQMIRANSKISFEDFKKEVKQNKQANITAIADVFFLLHPRNKEQVGEQAEANSKSQTE